jgi:hypothetical protein
MKVSTILECTVYSIKYGIEKNIVLTDGHKADEAGAGLLDESSSLAATFGVTINL